jgi:hypothetical protein
MGASLAKMESSCQTSEALTDIGKFSVCQHPASHAVFDQGSCGCIKQPMLSVYPGLQDFRYLLPGKARSRHLLQHVAAPTYFDPHLHLSKFWASLWTAAIGCLDKHL